MSPKWLPKAGCGAKVSRTSPSATSAEVTSNGVSAAQTGRLPGDNAERNASRSEATRHPRTRTIAAVSHVGLRTKHPRVAPEPALTFRRPTFRVNPGTQMSAPTPIWIDYRPYGG